MSPLTAAARIGREIQRLAADRLGHRAGFPATAAGLDATTLAAVLGRDVLRVSVLDGTSGTTDRCRLGVDGPGLPTSVFVKMAARQAGTRLFGGLARLGEVEVGFYRDLRRRLTIEAPHLLGARFHQGTGRFVVVTEDLTIRGATFADTLTPLSPDQMASALSTLAALHGGSQALVHPAPAWLTTHSRDAMTPLVAAVIGRLARRVTARDPTLIPDGGRQILRNVRQWALTLDAGPQTVLHGDPHPGNLYFTDHRVGLLDWQAVRRGNGLRDVAYSIVLSLTVADRRACERELLDHYRGELRSAGGPPLDAPTTWTCYRQMAAYTYLAAVFTYGLGGLQGDDIADEGVRRAVAAITDLDTAAALRLR